jgi:hypothetical protein
MPQGKKAGERCVQLTSSNQCAIFGDPSRPAVCASLQAMAEMCGTSRTEALVYLGELERLTAPRGISDQ